jgi:hypothetical protein
LASTRLVEAVQPLRDVVDSLHGWLLQAGNLLEHAEAALSRLSVVPTVEKPPSTSPPLSELDVDLVDGGDAELYGCFSPRATIASSTLPTFPTVDEVSIMTPAPVLQIMPELHKLCGELISPLSGMHPKMGSLVDSTVALTLTPALLEPSQGFPDVTSTTHDVATLSSEFVGQVVPVGDDVVVARASVPDLGDIFAIKLNDFLTNLDPSMSKAVRRLLRGKALPRREKLNKCKIKKCGDKGVAQVAP